MMSWKSTTCGVSRQWVIKGERAPGVNQKQQRKTGNLKTTPGQTKQKLKSLPKNKPFQKWSRILFPQQNGQARKIIQKQICHLYINIGTFVFIHGVHRGESKRCLKCIGLISNNFCPINC